MLAFMPEVERDAVMAGMTFERFQPRTISSRKAFLKCLDEVRQTGWALDVGEHLEGHHCLGAPILGADGNAIASLWISGPSQRLSEERLAKLAPVVKKAGAMATAALNPSHLNL
jgi:DNA-binding IclR family transcriptional regulator